MSQTDDFDEFEAYDDNPVLDEPVEDDVDDLRRRLEAAEAKLRDDTEHNDSAEQTRAAELNLQRTRQRGKKGRKAKRTDTRIPETAPRPQDRQPKKLAQQSEAEDVELVITAFDDEFRIRRSALQDNWQFFAASAVGNIPGMLVQVLGQKGFVRFCQSAMEAGKKPTEAAREMWDLIGDALGMDNGGNS